MSTAQNKEAMNRSVAEVAKGIVRDGAIADKDLNQLEIAIRCYDPCLSCSTHAHGHMPLEVSLRDADGREQARYTHPKPRG